MHSQPGWRDSYCQLITRLIAEGATTLPTSSTCSWTMSPTSSRGRTRWRRFYVSGRNEHRPRRRHVHRPGSGWNAPTPELKTPPLAERRLDISNNNQPTGFAYMNTLTLSSDAFSFSLSNPAAVEGAFLAHLARFEAQDRDVSWQDAPAAFAFASSDAGVETLTNLFRAAMEDLLDSGEIRVERLAGGGNRLVRASSTETAVTCENTP